MIEAYIIAILTGESTMQEKTLVVGSFYWVRVVDLVLAEDGRSLRRADKVSDFQPALFTGMSGGSPPRLTWDFIGKPSSDEMAVVTEIGPSIAHSPENYGALESALLIGI